MQDAAKQEQFVQQLTEHQNRLFGYIYSLLGDHSRAGDVLQETNLVLWRKIGEFESGAEFLPWAFAIARFQVLAHLRDHKRDRLLLDPELVESIGHEAEAQAGRIEEIQTALRACLQKLTPKNRQLVEQKYFRSMQIADLAAAVDQSVSAVKVALLRSRRQLAECVEKRLAGEG